MLISEGSIDIFQFGDDIVVFANSEEELMEVLEGMDSILKTEHKMKINEHEA